MYLLTMRTTIELSEEQRARLLELAARRSEKGFSRLIGEALDHYLDNQLSHEALTRALSAKGSFSAKEADALQSATAEIRSRWR
jgi:predicted transcriptional regulator